MAHGKSDAEIIQSTQNTARFFVENRHVAWVLLIAVVLWGLYGYVAMPQRKAPDVPVRVAVAPAPWPGVSAEKIAQLVTRKLAEKVLKMPGWSKSSRSRAPALPMLPRYAPSWPTLPL